MKSKPITCFIFLLLSFTCVLTASAAELKMRITKTYLNIPIGKQARMKRFSINVDHKSKRDFPAQLAENQIDYWIYIDVSEFIGQEITLSGYASVAALGRIYQDDEIAGADSLYRESNRPAFHFTVKRGWSNDINGPVYYNGVYHLFWQAFPFGLSWNTAYMYWGHATSKDLLRWKEHAPALMLDSLGSPWSGTAVIDKENIGGWGKNAMVLYYTAYDEVSRKQVQCIAYSTDEGKTFKRYGGNPVIDSNEAAGSNDTRDPKVLYYAPANIWIMVLFERDGLTFYDSRDMKNWTRQSHFSGLFECPDFFEIPVEGDSATKKWILHGGGSDYFIGSFDGKVFHLESEKLKYAPGAWDYLYAAESFENMPDNRRVQIAWGRIEHKGMPFNQMMLFPTEFTLVKKPEGLRLVANPIREIETLHANTKTWKSRSVVQANQDMDNIGNGPQHIKLDLDFKNSGFIKLFFQGNEIVNLSAKDFKNPLNSLEILIDKSVMEIFINRGEHYIVRKLNDKLNAKGLNFESDGKEIGIQNLQASQMKSVWE